MIQRNLKSTIQTLEGVFNCVSVDFDKCTKNKKTQLQSNKVKGPLTPNFKLKMFVLFDSPAYMGDYH